MRNYYIYLFVALFWLTVPVPVSAEQVLTAARVTEAPVVDGRGDDPVWERAEALCTHDGIADIDVNIKCVYTGTDIYFWVNFRDPDESRLHKPWVWNSEKGKYEMGSQREDCFVLKWALSRELSDLSIHADTPYAADIWFWKACRTDPAGHADDKLQILNAGYIRGSQEIISRNGKIFYLQRLGDKGAPAYRSMLKLDYEGDSITQFERQSPSGSRADIRAKGAWTAGSWTIEFARPLVTGHSDDIQFDINKKHLFGISRYEIAGRKPNPSLSQPLYGSGDVAEALYLVFQK